MIEFGKKSLLVSVNVIKDFIKMMISLTTGLITVLGSYFPIWGKFLSYHLSSIPKHLLSYFSRKRSKLL
jgi:hypothetical protein